VTTRILLKVRVRRGLLTVRLLDLYLDYIDIVVTGKVSLTLCGSISRTLSKILKRIDELRATVKDHSCRLAIENVYAKGNSMFIIARCSLCGRPVFVSITRRKS